MTTHRFAALAAALSLCLLPACGSDDDSGSGGGGSGSSEPTAFAVEVSESGKSSELTVPESVEAGLVEVTFENTGKAPHAVQFVRVDGDQTAADVQKVTGGQGAIPGWLHGAGGIGTVAPGQSGTAIVSLDPGTYYAEDDEADKGGIAKFEVTGEASDAELPQTEATIVASEYKFTADGLKPGANRITFDNAGEELHHAIAAPIAEGKTIADVKKFLMTEGRPSGPPPVDFESSVGTAVLDGGAKEVVDLELKAGRYAFVCFIPDRAGGPPHFIKGMLQEIKVPS